MKLKPHFLTIIRSLQRELDPKKPILLGFSGGSDSTMLLDLLLKLHAVYPIDLHVIHVDHGWRVTSSDEAAYLQKKCQLLPLTFHLRKVSGVDPRKNSNLEDVYRDKRYALFLEVYEKIQAQALLLAHHQDDEVETTLKRVLEGASLYHLNGMTRHSYLYGMNIIRPCLAISKSMMTEYIQEKGLQFIKDSTNYDVNYLRPRMRLEIFPLLEETFGKHIKAPLHKISEEAERLKAYLKEKTSPFLRFFYTTCYGGFIDFNELPSLHELEMEFFLKNILSGFEESLSHQQLKALVTLIKSHKANKCIKIKELEIQIDRARVFFFHRTKIEPFYQADSNTITYTHLKITMVQDKELSKDHDLISLFKKGSFSAGFPEETFFFEPLRSLERDSFVAIRQLLEQHKIPAFLWDMLPVLKDRKGKLWYPWIKGALEGPKRMRCILEKSSLEKKNCLEIKDKFSRLC